MTTMKAAVWYEPKDVRVEDVTIPDVGEKQVKVAVKYTGICGSDFYSCR